MSETQEPQPPVDDEDQGLVPGPTDQPADEPDEEEDEEEEEVDDTPSTDTPEGSPS